MPSKDKKSGTTNATKSDASEGTQSTATVEERLDQEQKQGFRGIEVDPTPNENYTVAGVTSGAPTPETDAGLAADVRKDTGLGLSPLEAAEREKAQRGEK
jgi:hypothetical protein